MKAILLAAGILGSPMLLARGADTPVPANAKGQALDTSFLKLYAETRGFMLGRPNKPKVTPDGKAVLFLRGEAKSPKMKLFEFDVATGKTKELLSPESLLKGADENLTPEEKARRERQRVSTGGFADFHLDPDGKQVLVKLSNRLFVLDRASGKSTELKTGAGGAIVDPKWSPDGKLIGYVRGYDVYAYDLAVGKEFAITTGGTAVKTHGLAEFVAQEEMGRHSGFWWSPDSKMIAYEEADHTGVEQWFVADPLKPEVPPAPQYYPRPGKKNVSVRLGVKKLEGGETVWMKWFKGEETPNNEYMVRVSWDKYGPLTILLEDRKQQHIDVISANSDTGQAERLFSMSPLEKDFWIDLEQVNIHWTKEGKAAYLGKHIGITINRGDKHTPFARLYGHFDHPQAVVNFNGNTGEALINASWDPHLMHSYLVTILPGAEDIKMSQNRQLSYGKGIQTIAGNEELAVVTSSSPTSMPVSRVVNPKGNQETNEKTSIFSPLFMFTQFPIGGKLIGRLPSLALEPPFIPNLTFVPNPPEPNTITDDSWGRSNPVRDDQFIAAIVRPQNFDSRKKYPVIVDVYGGPKHLHVVQAMRNWLVPQWLADQGFIVVAIDNRGTPGRGTDWEKAIYKKFGTVPIEDQVKGLDALCKQFPEMDRERVGIVGWSFGGYMAANGVLRRPDVFKAAVAGAPVTDWEDYDTHYTERYMGLLPESKAAYDEASLIPLAKNLSRPLLLVHGTADDNVYYRHTLKLSNALFRAGREFEALALPGVTHMVSADPVVMERLWSKTAGFFKKHLGEVK